MPLNCGESAKFALPPFGELGTLFDSTEKLFEMGSIVVASSCWQANIPLSRL